jgi:uncharacterized protein (DUF2336 family)
MQANLIKELEDAIAGGSPQRRSEMLMQVTNLFVAGSAKFSEDEITLFDNVITRLAAEIEVSVRALLAERLAPLPRAPVTIAQVLASDDDIRVAGPILVQSEQLDPATLLVNAQSKSQAHLLAISQRKLLSEELTDVLIQRGDRQVALSTAKNLGARLSAIGFSLLVKRADGDDALAMCVGARPDIPREVFLTLLATASEMVRTKLTAERPAFAEEIEHAVTAVTDKRRSEVTAQSTAYTNAEILVLSLAKSGQLTEAAVCAFAKDGRFERVIASIAQICDLPGEIVEQAFLRDQSETILILAKAARLSWPTAKALLSLGAKRQNLHVLRCEHNMASFDRLNFNTAKRIIEFYRRRRMGVLAPDELVGTESQRSYH